MRFVEFIRKFPSNRRSQVLATLYFNKHEAATPSMTAIEIRTALVGASVTGARGMNVSDVLNKAIPLVDRAGGGSWELTDSGETAVREVIGEPAPIKAPALSDVAQLRVMSSQMKNLDARSYVDEAIDCLEAGAHRAAIVFMWAAAVHEIQERVWAASTPSAITAAAQLHSPRAKVAKKRDDLVEYNEDLLLQVAHDLGVLDKNEKSELGKALSLRNSSGHPNKLRPGEHKAKAHIEEIVGMLFR